RTRCSSCWISGAWTARPAPPARPGWSRPARCSPRWGSRRRRPAGRCASPWDGRAPSGMWRSSSPPSRRRSSAPAPSAPCTADRTPSALASGRISRSQELPRGQHLRTLDAQDGEDLRGRRQGMKVLAAMSGGVDSAVAAARAAEAGHEVVGVHMALSKSRDQTRSGSRGCCTVEDASDARRAADRIGIPYYVWDLSDDFHDLVVEDFIAEYAAGRTPNPCVRCNERIKFASLLERATLLGFDAVCTGHYASIRTDGPGGAPSLHRSRNMAKDQSYVLAVMGPDAVGRSLFPLGEYETKEEVRA